MRNTAIHAPAEDWLVWEVPGKPVSVRLTTEVAERMAAAVTEGFKALPRRGLETGGLLLGTRRDTGSRVVVDVRDFEAIESEHAAGPSYLLSSPDRRLLEARISARKGSIVGFYRSHTRRGFAITTEDAALFSTYFRKASDVFLLIKSNGDGPPAAGFLIREDGRVLSDTPYVSVPLHPGALPIPAPEAPIAALGPQPVPEPVAAPKVEPFVPAVSTPRPVVPEPVVAPEIDSSVPAVPNPQQPVVVAESPRGLVVPKVPKPRRTWNRWTAGAAGAIVLTGILVWGLRTFVPSSTPPQPAVPLAMRVAISDDSLRVSWDHRAVRDAGHGILVIKDGQDETRIELDARQLNEGSVTYWPHTSDVTFRLELPLSGAGVTESVRALGGPSNLPAAAPLTEAATEPAPATPTAGTAPPALEPATRKSSASRESLRAFVLPPRAEPDIPPAPASLPDAPAIPSPESLPREQGDTLLKLGSALPAPDANPSVRVTAEPVSDSRMERLARSLPLIGKRYRRPDYVPPTPLPHPPLPEVPRGMVAQERKIDVKVQVNAAGKVEFAEALSDAAQQNPDLVTLAVFSARRWQFVPAHTNEGAVPGEVILHYHFLPGTSAGGVASAK